MILVAGATGNLGGAICRRLAAAGRPVRALVRAGANPRKVEQLQALGICPVPGDLTDPPSLRAACQGVEALISTATAAPARQPGDSIPVVDQQGQLDLIEAGRAAGAACFIYISLPQGLADCPLTRAKRAVELALQNSGMAYTILRPGLFMETWLAPALGFDYPNARAVIYGDGYALNSYIACQDAARYAVESLDSPAARNEAFEIGLPRPYNLLEVVRVFEKNGGKPFELAFIPAAALQARQAASTDPFQVSLAALMHQMALGQPLDCARAAQAFAIPLVSLEDYARGVFGNQTLPQ